MSIFADPRRFSVGDEYEQWKQEAKWETRMDNEEPLQECCGKCEHHIHDEKYGWYCGCDESDYCGEDVGYSDCCDQYEEKL